MGSESKEVVDHLKKAYIELKPHVPKLYYEPGEEPSEGLVLVSDLMADGSKSEEA